MEKLHILSIASSPDYQPAGIERISKNEAFVAKNELILVLRTTERNYPPHHAYIPDIKSAQMCLNYAFVFVKNCCKRLTGRKKRPKEKGQATSKAVGRAEIVARFESTAFF